MDSDVLRGAARKLLRLKCKTVQREGDIKHNTWRWQFHAGPDRQDIQRVIGGEKKKSVATFSEHQVRKSNSLVMVLLSENRFAEKPRATLGGASSEGHSLQHCIEDDSRTGQTGESEKPRSTALVPS